MIRCLNVSHECPGNGIAKNCEAAGGSRKLLSVHMQEFWTKIKYSPGIPPTTEELAENDDDIELQVGGSFTSEPNKSGSHYENKSKKKCQAVSIKWFPKKADHGDIMEFLVQSGLPKDHDCVNIKDNGQVIISNLDPKICDTLCETITGSKFKDKKTIYCQGIILATPEKSAASSQPVPSLSQSALTGKQNNSVVTLNSNSKDDEYDFNDLRQSKFFARGSESESDDLDDSIETEADNWTTNSNKRKKKKMLTNSVAIKKVNNKTTPKSKQ